MKINELITLQRVQLVALVFFLVAIPFEQKTCLVKLAQFFSGAFFLQQKSTKRKFPESFVNIFDVEHLVLGDVNRHNQQSYLLISAWKILVKLDHFPK